MQIPKQQQDSHPRKRLLRQTAFVTILSIGVAGGMPAADHAHAVDDTPKNWLSSEGVRRQLEQPLSLQWSGVPLKQAVANLANAQHVAIVVDRRVDPDQEIELAVEDVSLNAALSSLAARLDCAAGHVGPVVYLGPTRTAERLQTLVELRKQEVGRLPPEPRKRLAALKRCRWPGLTTPRELLAEMAREYQLTIDNLQDVPHDLWPAGELPPLGFAERLSLLAANFDLTFDIIEDGRQVHLVSMPQQVVVEKSYRSQAPSADIARLAGRLTRSEIIAGSGKITIRGPAEEMELVDSILLRKPARQTSTSAGKKVYQLNIVMPAGRLIKELGPKLGLTIQLDETAIQKAGASLDKDVKVSVKDASEEELLRAVLEPAGLTFTREGTTVFVRPK